MNPKIKEYARTAAQAVRQNLKGLIGVYGVIFVFTLCWDCTGFYQWPQERWAQELGYVKAFVVKASQYARIHF